MTGFHVTGLEIGAIFFFIACTAALIAWVLIEARDKRELDECEQWELAKRQPGAAYAECDDHAVWSEDPLPVPPHRCGRLSWRRRERVRLHRELGLLLCVAASNRRRDDA